MNFMANMLLQEPADAVQAAVDAVNADLGILWIIIAAILVFFMQAGFTLVETGFTSAKNAGNIIMKNFMDLAVGSVMFWVVGYSIMYGGETILSLVKMTGTTCFSRRCSVRLQQQSFLVLLQDVLSSHLT